MEQTDAAAAPGTGAQAVGRFATHKHIDLTLVEASPLPTGVVFMRYRRAVKGKVRDGMKAALAVGFGGLLGSLARYKLGGLVLHHTESWRFPMSTFVVNLLGCALVGVLAGIAEHRHGLNPAARLFLITGFCGGFTTFSAFGIETVYLLRRHEAPWALANVVASVVVGVAAVWIGWRAVELFSR